MSEKAPTNQSSTGWTLPHEKNSFTKKRQIVTEEAGVDAFSFGAASRLTMGYKERVLKSIWGFQLGLQASGTSPQDITYMWSGFLTSGAQDKRTWRCPSVEPIPFQFYYMVPLSKKSSHWLETNRTDREKSTSHNQ